MMREFAIIDEIITRTPDGLTARWWLDDRRGAGRVVLLLDGDAYTYCWPRRNRGGEKADSLLGWLADLATVSYVAKKMGAMEFDAEAAEATARELVLQSRRSGVLTEGQARDLWDILIIGSADDVDPFLNACAETEMDCYELYSIPDARRVLPSFRAAFAALCEVADGE